LTGYASAVQLAQREWELGNVARVRTVLKSLIPLAGEDDLRGYEWHYLRRQCDDAALTLELPGGQSLPYGGLDRIELGPDGTRVLAVAGGRVIGWTLPGGKAVTLAESSDRFVLDARFSPDGKRMALLVLALEGKPFPADGRIDESAASLEIWDAQTDKRLRSTALRKGSYGNLAYRPNGRYVAARLNQFEGRTIDTGHNWVFVVDEQTGLVVRSFEGKPINEALTFSPDGSLLVGPSDSHTLNVWDAETGKVLRTIDTKEPIVRDAAFNSDGTRLAVVGDSGRATIWSVPGWQTVQSLRVSEQHAYRCRFSRDGKILATLGYSSIKLWDGLTGEYLFLIRGALSDLALTPGGERIAAQGDAGTVRFWDTRQEQGALVHHAKDNLYDAAFSRDGKWINNAEGTILDGATGAVLRTIPAPSGQSILLTALFPDRHRAAIFRSKSPLLADTNSGELVLWEVDAGRELKKLEGLPFIFDLAVSPDGLWIITQNGREGDETHTQHELVVRDATTLKPVLTRSNPPVYGRYALFTNDSHAVAVGSKDGVLILEIPSGQELKNYGPLDSHPLCLAISHDGRWVAAATSRGRQGGSMVHTWDAATGASVQVILQTASEDVTTLSFSPDGRRLASAGFDAKVKVWDTETGLELLTLSGHKSWIWKMHFSPDGQRILSCGRDRTLRVWDASALSHEVVSSR
jgi:WD40 repeat protein